MIAAILQGKKIVASYWNKYIQKYINDSITEKDMSKKLVNLCKCYQ